MPTKTRCFHALSGLLVLVSVAILPVTLPAADPVMYARFINVGQGACTLLEFPCGAILIDTGGDGNGNVDNLVDYLEAFFARRPDLNRTLESVIITHPHIDHTRGLRKVVEKFTVKRYIDDGHINGSGRFNPIWVRKQVADGIRDIVIKEIQDDQIVGSGGLTDGDIDPVGCAACDPVVTVLAGGYEDNPGWPEDEYDNLNNHSVVVRVDFGQSSFLFTGDLEESGIDHLMERYRDTPKLDVDVYMVGHHGAKNATTSAFLEEITPEIAVISMGKWDDGKNPFNTFSTYAYGHPRANAVEMLSLAIQGRRSSPIDAMVADGARNFRSVKVRKKIYATGWDGHVNVRATLEGKYIVTHGNN